MKTVQHPQTFLQAENRAARFNRKPLLLNLMIKNQQNYFHIKIFKGLSLHGNIVKEYKK